MLKMTLIEGSGNSWPIAGASVYLTFRTPAYLGSSNVSGISTNDMALT